VSIQGNYKMNTVTEQIKEPIGRIMGNISRAFLSELHDNLSHLDIDRSFYPLLLIDAGNGNITQNELAAKLSCDKVQVVRIIDYLSSNGYVERAKNAEDRRKCSLEITDKARKVLPDIKMAIRKTSVIALKNIPENKINELYGLLAIIDHNLSSHKVE
jgi:MarR family transcriptional regulator, transcriptional regulator for hemolysin